MLSSITFHQITFSIIFLYIMMAFPIYNTLLLICIITEKKIFVKSLMKVKFTRSLLSIIAKIARIVFEDVGAFWGQVSHL